MADADGGTAVSTVLVDFGGVLTTSVLGSFREFGAQLGRPDLPARLLSTDETARRLISDHECGRIGAEEFERGFAGRLRAYGAETDAEGLIARMMAGVRPDDAMLDLVTRLRTGGTPVALVSNAFGRDGYAGFDLESLVDRVVISSDLGVRKPSRRIYAAACEAMDVEPAAAVMIDDLQQNLDGAARLGISGILHADAVGTERQLAQRFGITAR